MKVSVLIADKFPELYVKQLEEMGLDVIYSPKLGENDLPAAAVEVNIIVVRSTVVNAETIKQSKKLNLIIRAGAGVNNINMPAANEKGVYVANCPGMNSVAVAELALGLMLSLDRRIPNNVIDFNNGVWNKAEYSKADGMLGKTLGIIGVGAIGKEVAKRALSFGMKVYGKDIIKDETLPITYIDDMEKLLPLCDVISLHLPSNAQTKGMFNKELLSYLKPGAFLINTSRSEVIDEDALLEVITEKKIKVGIDVFKGEPEGKDGSVSSKLQGNPNVYVTHHIGASTEQAQNAVAEETVRIVDTYVKTGSILHWVNKAKKSQAKYQLVVKYFDKPGVLASVLTILKDANVGLEQIENLAFDGGLVSCCTLKLKDELGSEHLSKVSGLGEIISSSYAQL